jgi:hypothetical protein
MEYTMYDTVVNIYIFFGYCGIQTQDNLSSK